MLEILVLDPEIDLYSMVCLHKESGVNTKIEMYNLQCATIGICSLLLFVLQEILRRVKNP